MRVIVPSAKIVNEELQSIGKLPAIIYPINRRIVLDYLLDQYEHIVDGIDIVCYEKSDIVHRRLSCYRSEKIHIIDLTCLQDLGHTIYYGIGDSDGPIIINFADTIVMEKVESLPLDSFYYSKDYQSDIWTFFDISEGRLHNISDKNSCDIDQNNIGKLFVGVFCISDSRLLKKCLAQSFFEIDSGISSFYKALMYYSSIRPLKDIYSEKWFDIGHQDKYYSSALEVKAREFNHITIDKDRGILRKTSDDIEKFIGEIRWYLKLPSDIEYVRPRIFDYSTSYSAPFVSMEYYAYHTVHELFVFGDLTKKQWKDIFSRISFVFKDFSRYSVCDGRIRAALEDMYLKKTLQRMEQMRNNKLFKSFFENEISVNGIQYNSLDEIIRKLQSTIPEMLYDVDSFTIIHGDLCFANIMVDSNYSFIKVIDPRGKFGEFDIYGDQRYELAKLFHSVDGKYDYIIKDLYTINYDPDRCVINYRILDRNRNFNIFELFVESFKEEIRTDIRKIELIEALLFLSMIPLHSESIEHQMVMMGTGLDILNRVVGIESKK